jgi:multidrug efflux pump subunit AcrA (membrane-fusion protein)
VAEDEAEPSQTDPEPAADTRPQDPLRILLAEIDRLHDVLDAKRLELAEIRLEVLETRRELQELRQFIRDNETLGRDFEQYRAVKAVAERDARRRQALEARERRAIEKADRAAQMQAAKAEREKGQAAFNRLARYREAGFSPLGFDVYLADISFNYSATDGGAPARIDWDFRMGHYVRLYPFAAGREIDFTAMTISGSVLNASQEVRNIGVAVAFFDENGSQVGGEIIQINNACPTATVELDRVARFPMLGSWQIAGSGRVASSCRWPSWWWRGGCPCGAPTAARSRPRWFDAW